MADVVKIEKGLEGVYFTESNICKVDGTLGRLYYRGYSIEELAENSTFEEVSYLLLFGTLPKKSELNAFKKNLATKRALPKEIIKIIEDGVNKCDTMHILRTAVSALPLYDNEINNKNSNNLYDSINLISKVASITATIGRYLSKKKYIAPNKSLGHAENFLYMLNGTLPSKKDTKILDKMMILHAEHSSNASTFSALVTASTLSDIYSAFASAIGTLKGPLHGEADENALRMMYAIKNANNTENYINNALNKKERIMGFGHRIYKTYDPRARIIRGLLTEMQKSGNTEIKNITEIAIAAEKMMIEKLGASHGIWPNVDFFAGPVYRYINIPIDIFTPLFATGRSPGWCAHIIEYWENNRLIRPLELYKGRINLHYKKISSR